MEEYLSNVKLANEWADAYYIKDSPVATDEEYDNLISKIKEYEKLHPDNISKDSPTQKISNFKQSKFYKSTHLVRMWSMIDIFTIEELKEWLSKTKGDLYIEPKFDGGSLNILYENGELIKASTRGDSFEGEDVTLNALQIDNIPKTISYKGKIEIRGEIVIETKDFDKLNQDRLEQGLPLLSNPRNAATGSIRQLDVNITKERNLKFYPWGVGYNELKYTNHDELMDFIRSLGFLQDKHYVVKNSVEAVEAMYNLFIKERFDKPMMLDGMVVRLNNIEAFDQMGYIIKAPKGSVAFKFPAIEKTTIITDVKNQVGRTGVITPVGIIEPVNIDGVIVSNVTLHNYDYVNKIDLHIGDTVSIIRSGDVIPKLISVYKDRRPSNATKITKPIHCSCCNTLLTQTGSILKCPNKACKERVINNLVFFCNRKNMNIEGLSRQTIEILYNHGLLKEPSDLYKLQYKDIIDLEGFQDTKANNLLRAIDNSKVVKLSKFISSLGIDLIGESAANKLAIRFGKGWLDLDKNDYDTKEWYQTLLKIDGFGSTMIDSIYNYLKDNIASIKALIEELDIKYPNDSKSLLKGKEIVITGTLTNSRNFYKDKIEDNGGILSNNVTNKTSYLLLGDNPGSKYQKALSLDIPIISEDEFMKLLN